MNARPSQPTLRLRVTTAAESALRSGHPWLFADRIREQNRPGQLGEVGVVYDRQDRFLAAGLFDPDSAIRLRVLVAGKPAKITPGWWRERLISALEKRAGLFDERTNAYRLINGESDGWPGLVLDRYADTLVLKVYTAAWLPRLEEVIATIDDQLKPARQVLRLSRNTQTVAKAKFQRCDGQTLTGQSLDGSITFLENGLRFEADVCRGQKTGFFLDQRENRQRVESLARGCRVLNAFSFSGGFSLYAARGGAHCVTDLDLSPHALASGRRNFALAETNPIIPKCPREEIQGDAFEWLPRNRRRKFDLVILDPPSLAKREAEHSQAIKAYGNLVTAGLACVAPGGVLVACSCSAHVSEEEFFGAVRQVARASRRRVTEIETTRQPPDHPAAFPEARYLKAIYLRTGC